MIAVIDYGVANLASIMNMLRKVGTHAAVASTARDLESADSIILPGVGAFDSGMQALIAAGLVGPITERVMEAKVPLLGICLGMQILGRGSEEGDSSGLGLIDGYCKRFRFEADSKLKVPHMGWAVLDPLRECVLTDDLDSKARFYFVHSYHMVCANPTDVVATATFGVTFTAVVNRGNVYGAQFHPEKSHRFGMELLSRFANLT